MKDFETHPRGTGAELERLREENAEQRRLLEMAIERMNRARGILTGNNPRPECNWGMLDTSDLKGKA